MVSVTLIFPPTGSRGENATENVKRYLAGGFARGTDARTGNKEPYIFL